MIKEKQKIEEELAEKLAFIKECQEILASQARILDIVKTEALNLRDKYADERRTEISAVSGEVDIEDLIPEVCYFCRCRLRGRYQCIGIVQLGKKFLGRDVNPFIILLSIDEKAHRQKINAQLLCLLLRQTAVGIGYNCNTVHNVSPHKTFF